MFYQVPGWPIGFGNDDKAEVLLEKALVINPDGIDSNYFFADYLVSEKRYEEAGEYFNRALKAAPRPGREIADEGEKARDTGGIEQAQ